MEVTRAGPPFYICFFHFFFVDVHAHVRTYVLLPRYSLVKPMMSENFVPKKSLVIGKWGGKQDCSNNTLVGSIPLLVQGRAGHAVLHLTIMVMGL